MRVKQVIIPLLLILILVMFNRVFLNTFSRANDYFAHQSVYQNETSTPQKLFDKTWKIVHKDYYDPSLNHQDWSRWKSRYQGKIKTDEDAKVAIDTMIASLNEPYTRFMNKKDFSDLTTSITSKIYGIGVNIYSNAGKIEVFNVIPSTPADISGVKQGDVIVAVDGKDTNGMSVSEVATLVRGPENSIVELTIAQCEPGVRGDTVKTGGKPATLETGYVIQVPLFVNEGERVRVDTRTGEYMERV